MRLQLIAASAALVLFTAPAMAQEKVGIAECDDFLEKYEACVKNMPTASQQTTRDSIVQMRTAWKAAATDASSKAALATSCKSSAASMKQSMSAYGCKF